MDNGVNGLVAAYILDGKGGAREITWKEVYAWAPSQGILWVHLHYPDEQAQAWLHEASGIDPVALSSMLVDEVRPRSEFFPDGILSCLRGVNLNPGHDPEDMVSIRVWIEKNRIISTRKRQLLSIADLRNGLQMGHGPKTPGAFLIYLNDRLIDRMADVIDTVSDQVDSLEEAVTTEESRALRPQIAESRREAIMIRRYLAPQREALYRLQLEKSKLFSSVDLLRLRESVDRLTRYIEDLDTARDRAGITQEELSSRISEQMDARMYRLSVVAMIFLPITFITGYLGINVGGIPGTTNKHAFWAVGGILLIITAAIMFFLKKKKWM